MIIDFKNNFNQKHNMGFSMIEFLLAAFILSVGLLGLASLQVMAISQASNGRGRTTAAYIANVVLQRAQMEGQHYYLAKSNSLTPAMTAVFTASPSTALVNQPYGGFNIDGVQVTDSSNNPIAGLATLVPDVNKRNTVFTATWTRRAYAGTAPASLSQTQEFVVNLTWVEGAQNKYLSLSRDIRY